MLAAAALAPLGALGYSLLQVEQYSAEAAVLVSSGGAATTLRAVPGFASTDDPSRLTATHVTLARLPSVASRVIVEAPLFEDPESFLARSSVSVDPDTDVLRFEVRDTDPEQAKTLATIYAREFTSYRNQLDLRAIRSTQAAISRRLAQLAAAGQRNSPLYAELRSAMRELDATEALRGSAAIVVQPAVDVRQVSPRTTRNLVLGLVVGFMLGVGLALVVDRLDTRVRSAEEAEAILGVPLLGELPRPPDLPKGAATRVCMLEVPQGPYAESVRKLRANLEFTSIDGARVLMVTSGVVGEGKTTIAGDLAVALARSGRRVALCDLDLRAPQIDAMFALPRRSGLVEVALGEPLERALVPVHWGVSEPHAQRPAADRHDELHVPVVPSRGSPPRGGLNVLTLGRRRPPSPADFVGSNAVRRIVSDLAATHDVVILDTPPLLAVSDSLAISEYTDTALIVCSLQKSKRPELLALRRLLLTLPTHVIGVAVTGVPPVADYGPYVVGHRESEAHTGGGSV